MTNLCFDHASKQIDIQSGRRPFSDDNQGLVSRHKARPNRGKGSRLTWWPAATSGGRREPRWIRVRPSQGRLPETTKTRLCRGQDRPAKGWPMKDAAQSKGCQGLTAARNRFDGGATGLRGPARKNFPLILNRLFWQISFSKKRHNWG